MNSEIVSAKEWRIYNRQNWFQFLEITVLKFIPFESYFKLRFSLQNKLFRVEFGQSSNWKVALYWNKSDILLVDNFFRVANSREVEALENDNHL